MAFGDEVDLVKAVSHQKRQKKVHSQFQYTSTAQQYLNNS